MQRSSQLNGSSDRLRHLNDSHKAEKRRFQADQTRLCFLPMEDWEDHSMGKEGTERYRTQNLPNWISCPGVYELGIAASRPRSGKGARKLDSTSVVPVYLGQADNLRTRLQQYGRDGAHLETGSSNDQFTNFQSVKQLGLFKDIFSRGFPIVYRCAPMKSKKEAEMTEKELLDKFDYAWNKGSNGARRQHDIFRKLDSCAKASQFSLLAKKILFYNQRQVGIKIRTPEPCLLQNEDKSVNFSRIFGIRRLQPRQTHYDPGDYCSTDICGVALGHGSVCTAPPVEGRKRCAAHKGMRINGNISKSKTEEKLSIIQSHKGMRIKAPVEADYTYVHRGSEEKFAPICGFILDDGSPCKRKPFQRNKRCLEHKGRRILKTQPKSVGEEIE